MRMLFVTLLTLLIAESAALPAEAATAPASRATAGTQPVELGRRYFNLPEGYSLCPPADASRVQVRGPSRLVSWSARDKASGAVAWTLGALAQPADLTEQGIEDSARQTAEKMAKNESIKVQSCQVITAAGRKAIDLRVTQTIHKGQYWLRYVIVPTEPGQSLTLNIFGPLARQDALLAMHQAVLDSLELLDRQALLKQREANLAAGRELLAGLTTEKLTGAIDNQDAWYLIEREGKAVGFMAVRERATTLGNRQGIEVKAWSMIESPDGATRQTTAVTAASADRSRESCNWVTGIGGTEKGARTLGMTKDGNKIVFTGASHAGPTEKVTETSQKALDESMDRCYLPVAISSMLGRLVDLAKAGSYAFAYYAGNADELDVYTFTVVGSGQVRVGVAQPPDAFRATVRPAEDAEEEVLLLDQAGRLLHKESPGQAIMKLSPRQEVLRQFPQAKTMLPEIDRDQAGARGAASEDK